MNASTEGTPCPTCQTVPDPQTGLCLCVRPAADPTAAATVPSGPLLAQAESLFENYLAARLVRARRTLTTAKVAMLRDPRNRAKLDALRRAEAEVAKLQTQLVEQARKSAQAREALPASHRGSVPAASPHATEDFRALQASKAEAAYQSEMAESGRRSRPDNRDCPSCGNRVPADVTICVCGYQFVAADASVGAESFLSEEEITALRTKSAD